MNPRNPFQGRDPETPFSPDALRRQAFTMHAQADEIEEDNLQEGDGRPSHDSQILRQRGDFYLVEAEKLEVLGDLPAAYIELMLRMNPR